MSGQKYYVTVSDLPPFAGRCDASVLKRLFNGATERRQCSRSATHAYHGSKFCEQHHPDPDGAREGIEREQRVAEKAYAAARARRA